MGLHQRGMCRSNQADGLAPGSPEASTPPGSPPAPDPWLSISLPLLHGPVLLSQLRLPGWLSSFIHSPRKYLWSVRMMLCCCAPHPCSGPTQTPSPRCGPCRPAPAPLTYALLVLPFPGALGRHLWSGPAPLDSPECRPQAAQVQQVGPWHGQREPGRHRSATFPAPPSRVW